MNERRASSTEALLLKSSATLYSPIVHSVDVLVVRGEPQIILNIALRFETFRRDNLTHAELFGVLADPLDITDRILEWCCYVVFPNIT